MSPRRPPLVVLAAVLLLAGAACTSTETIASSDGGGGGASESGAAGAPPPTIGLGSDIGSPDDPGLDGGADAALGAAVGDGGERAANAGQIDAVVMIGDSITVGAEPALAERFDGLGYDDVVIEAQNGKRIAQEVSGNPSGVTIADSLVSSGVATDPSTELWVVALGTNDVGQYAERAEVEVVIDEMLAAVPTGAALVWVDTYLPGDPEGTRLVNDVVAERLAGRGNAVVAEWSALAGRDGVLSSDMVHPTDQGNEVFAATVAATVDRFVEG